VRSALVAIITLPIAIIMSFIPLYGLGLTSNIMSLGGIAIAIGAMIDAAIIIVENAHKALEHSRKSTDTIQPDRNVLRSSSTRPRASAGRCSFRFW
jgi:Cu(I)/Ag(I) efflux system membrane protein CusA/SilA